MACMAAIPLAADRCARDFITKLENAKKIPAISPQPSADTNARTKTKPSMSLKIFFITCLFDRHVCVSKPLRLIREKNYFGRFGGDGREDQSHSARSGRMYWQSTWLLNKHIARP